MMISSESVYNNLKAKSEKEIITKIRSIKNSIGNLKNKLEHPNYLKDFSDEQIINEICPSYLSQIERNRLYLKEAKRALYEVEGEYKISKAELRSIDFNININSIKKITFSIGGFPNPTNTFVADFFKEELSLNKLNYNSNKQIEVLDCDENPLSKKSFLEAIMNLYMGEWRRTYSLKRFVYEILDGTQWEIEIEYTNDLKKVSFEGSNSYPYNFNNFSRLFGIKEQYYVLRS